MDEPRPHDDDSPADGPAQDGATDGPQRGADDTRPFEAYGQTSASTSGQTYGAPAPPPLPPGGYGQGHTQGYSYGAPYAAFGQQPGEYPSQYPGQYPGEPGGPYGSYPLYAQPHHAKRRSRGPLLVATGAALAVVLAAGIGGFALGRSHRQAANAGNPPNGYTQIPGQNGQNGQGGYGNLDPFGNFGDPFSGQQGQTSGTAATADQLTGLVRVSTTLKYQGGAAAGTGMVLTSDGEVITNHHVVQGATHIEVTVMSTGTQYPAKVVGTDAKDDVAVLQLANASGLATVKTDTDGISVGDAVTAVGDAGGSETTFSAAAGTITATDQHITTHDADGSTGEKLSGLIEISSDVISGDSGGATYDAQGEVVGMTTAASTGNSDIVGYAIPIDTVLRIAGDLENHVQNARYAYGAPAFVGLGLSGQGTTVAGVYPGTPAAKAGITEGSRITAVDGSSVSTAAGLKKAIASHSPGDQVTLTWTDQQGSSHTVTVTLIQGPIA